MVCIHKQLSRNSLAVLKKGNLTLYLVHKPPTRNSGLGELFCYLQMQSPPAPPIPVFGSPQFPPVACASSGIRTPTQLSWREESEELFVLTIGTTNPESRQINVAAGGYSRIWPGLQGFRPRLKGEHPNNQWTVAGNYWCRV